MFPFSVKVTSSVSHESKPKHIHTVHHHHIQKYQVVEKIEVPKVKEIKVPFKVYHWEKVPYKYYVSPLIVKVPISYYHTKTEEFDKHHSAKHGGKDEESHHDEDHNDEEN